MTHNAKNYTTNCQPPAPALRDLADGEVERTGTVDARRHGDTQVVLHRNRLDRSVLGDLDLPKDGPFAVIEISEVQEANLQPRVDNQLAARLHHAEMRVMAGNRPAVVRLVKLDVARAENPRRALALGRMLGMARPETPRPDDQLLARVVPDLDRFAAPRLVHAFDAELELAGSGKGYFGVVGDWPVWLTCTDYYVMLFLDVASIPEGAKESLNASLKGWGKVAECKKQKLSLLLFSYIFHKKVGKTGKTGKKWHKPQENKGVLENHKTG